MQVYVHHCKGVDKQEAPLWTAPLILAGEITRAEYATVN